MPASMYDSGPVDGALALAMHMMSLQNSQGLIEDDIGLNFTTSIEQAKKSQNMTECVPVPSSEHVAEIVGRQGCKIKALRAKTNTYIKTPVRGEEPVFVVTGRKEDVAKAKKEILSAADHFSQIRASRKNNVGGLMGMTPPGPPMNLPGQVTIQVEVPYRVVGLVVGPKGATIKRIQQTTHTYIVTPSRDKDPVFEVTGLPENVETARREIQSHIASRTGVTSMPPPHFDTLSSMNFPEADSFEILDSLYKTGICGLANLLDDKPESNFSSTFASSSSGAFSSSGSISSSSSSSSGGRLTDLGSISSSSSSSGGRHIGDMNSIWSSSLDEGIGESFDGTLWSLSSTRPSPAASASPTESLNKRECLICSERENGAALLPCGHTHVCYECAYRLSEMQDGICPVCARGVSAAVRMY